MLSLRNRMVVALVWTVSLVLVAVVARAQVLRPVVPQPPTVVSGEDVGFRITGTKGDHVVGTLVVRQNGQWVQAELAGGVRQLTLK